MLFGEPEYGTVGPEQGTPLYKNNPNRGSGSLSRRWSRPGRGGSVPRSAELDRSERAYVVVLLEEPRDKQILVSTKRAASFTVFTNVEY